MAWGMVVVMYLQQCEVVVVLVQVRGWALHEERVKQREVWEVQREQEQAEERECWRLTGVE